MCIYKLVTLSESGKKCLIHNDFDEIAIGFSKYLETIPRAPKKRKKR